MTAVSVAFLLFSTYVAIANIAGGVSAVIRRRRDKSNPGYSCVPLLSLMFSMLAFWADRRALGLWAFVPAALDPGTWMLAALPFVLFSKRWQ